jgi:hypothetical protein
VVPDDVELLPNIDKLSIQGDVYLPGSKGYSDGRQLCVNGDEDAMTWPAAIAYPETAADVAQLVLHAAQSGVTVSVFCGGHSGSLAMKKNALCIMMRRMHAVVVDEESSSVRVQGGAMMSQVLEACAGTGKSPITGNYHDVGVGGWALGGGTGPIAAKYGLGCDNLLAAEVVLADGRIVVADAAREPDLFWALKGGGGHFGVVTEFTFKMHPVDPTFVGGPVIFLPFLLGSGGRAEWMRMFREKLESKNHEDEFLVSVMMKGGPCITVYTHLGADKAKATEEVAEYGSGWWPIRMTGEKDYYKDILNLEPDHGPKGDGAPKAKEMVMAFADLSDELIEVLDGIITDPACPTDTMCVLYPTYGVFNDVPDGATPLQRGAKMMVIWQVMTGSGDAKTKGAALQWAEPWKQQLLHAKGAAEDARTDGYRKLGLDMGVAGAFATGQGSVAQRLLSIKGRYDGGNLFPHNNKLVVTADDAAKALAKLDDASASTASA